MYCTCLYMCYLLASGKTMTCAYRTYVVIGMQSPLLRNYNKLTAERTAERMAHHYNSSRRTLVFNVGDVVSLRIPRIDRTSSDQPRPPCIVVEVKGKAQNLYLLR